jgi:IS30 family transposase
LRRNRYGGKKPKVRHPQTGSYDPQLAQVKYQNRRREAKYAGMLLHKNDGLRKYVIDKLKIGWSPKTIAGRMQQQKIPFYASDKAIYEYLYSPYGQKYCKYLRSKRYAKRKKKRRKQKRTLIPNKTSIHKRPKQITNKREYGHYEGDTIVSGKSTGSTTSLVTIYERKAMYIDAKKIKSLSPTDYNPAVKKLFAKLRSSKSWTLDNGIENVNYEELEKVLHIKSYFCDPYSSWQKPGVENANKLIRRFIPKGADISLYSDALIRKEIQKLNDTPRKALGWKTPNEVMTGQRLLKKKPNKKAP